MAYEASASDIIHHNSLQFGRYQIKTQLPHGVDGLKVVHRRILMSVKDLRKEFKSAKLIAATMENHPHGDQSIYQAAARLGQTFEYNPTPLHFLSSVGTYEEPTPAASRYTSAEVSEFAFDVFFKDVEYRTLPKELNEMLDGYEPIYLSTAIPTALLYANNTIGWGFPSYTVPHNLSDVCDLAVEFCRHQKQNPLVPFDYAKHAEKFLPDFPITGTLTNHRQLIAAYKRGDFKHRITTDGEVFLSADAIHISTLPYGIPFGKSDNKTKSLIMVIEDLILEKGSWFDRNILWVRPSEDNGVANVCVKLKRGVNVFEGWELLRKRISFSGAITPIPNYNDDGYAIEISQPNLLRVWYDARYNVMVASKKIRVTRLTEDLRRVEARLIVCDNVDTVVTLLRNNDDSTSIQKLQELYSLTLFQATYIVDTPMRILTTTSRAEMVKRKTELEQSLKELRDSFGKIPDEIITSALAIKKKYPSPRRTKIPAYVGYVRIGGGSIQLESIDEIPTILERFPRDALEIYRYDGPYQYRVTETGKLEMGYSPKITVGDIYGLKVDLESNPRSEKVITVNIVNGTGCCVKGFVPGLRKEGYFYTTPRSKVIDRDGTIRTVEVVEEFSPRKTISRGSATDVIYVYPEPKGEHFILVMNTSTLNEISILRVTPTLTKIPLNPTGTPYLVHSNETHVFLNLPPQYLNRNTTRVVEFLSIDKLLGSKDQLRINIGSAEIKKQKQIRLL